MRKVNRAILFFLCVCFSIVIKVNANIIQTDNLHITHFDASTLDWRLWCYRPNVWRMDFNFQQLSGNWAEYADLPMTIPGSVQNALKKADVIEDWNIGVNSQNIEWIENREWLVVTKLPDNIKIKEGGKYD